MENVVFKRNKDTGILETWKDGKYVGSIITMGNQIISIKPNVSYLLTSRGNSNGR